MGQQSVKTCSSLPHLHCHHSNLQAQPSWMMIEVPQETDRTTQTLDPLDIADRFRDHSRMRLLVLKQLEDDVLDSVAKKVA